MNHESRYRFALRLLLVAAYWLALFLLPHLARPKFPAGMHADKLAHFAGFALLAALVAWALQALGRMTWNRYLLILAAVAVYGAADEAVQVFLRYRNGDVLDWLADIGGATCGLAAHWLGTKNFSRPPRHLPANVPLVKLHESD